MHNCVWLFLLTYFLGRGDPHFFKPYGNSSFCEKRNGCPNTRECGHNRQFRRGVGAESCRRVVELFLPQEINRSVSLFLGVDAAAAVCATCAQQTPIVLAANTLTVFQVFQPEKQCHSGIVIIVNCQFFFLSLVPYI